ncbi:MAG: vitamin B12 dependent methionine synthase [Clostridiaceae bacterium]|nr:vitamin B12 dependent methionine synthase [Clostridiaceae bacterium]
MQYAIVSPKAEPLELGALLTKLHMDEESEREDIEQIGRMAAQALAVAKPCAMYRVVPIDAHGEDFVTLGEARFTSSLVAKNLLECHVCVPYVATCGTELEAWAEGYSADFMAQFWADEIMLAFHRQAVKALNKAVFTDVFGRGKYASMNPGSLSTWPISEQAPLFCTLGAELLPNGFYKLPIGVRLTKEYLMLPAKSVSGIFFTDKSGFVNCRLCPKLTCPNRRAPFDGMNP